MTSPALLYTVLIEGLESQGLEPSPRKELEEQFRQELPEFDVKLGPLRLSDPKEYERRLDAERVKMFYAWLHKKNFRRSALCFSGGGVRSATFGLGLVQGLGRCRLLGHFHYLSTVWGGGYLGSWLTGWIYRERKKLVDALYTESQFESYRELGSHIMRKILEQIPPGGTLDDQFFEKIKSQLGEMPDCD
ncbi:MAG TPA: hypothetical protein VLX28_14255 [Thermoanaerobaculia bacterium]|nr:hypothetical protein [Thermoanaerobaculia bacterium]